MNLRPSKKKIEKQNLENTVLVLGLLDPFQIKKICNDRHLFYERISLPENIDMKKVKSHFHFIISFGVYANFKKVIDSLKPEIKQKFFIMTEIDNFQKIPQQIKCGVFCEKLQDIMSRGLWEATISGQEQLKKIKQKEIKEQAKKERSEKRIKKFWKKIRQMLK